MNHNKNKRIHRFVDAAEKLSNFGIVGLAMALGLLTSALVPLDVLAQTADRASDATDPTTRDNSDGSSYLPQPPRGFDRRSGAGLRSGFNSTRTQSRRPGDVRPGSEVFGRASRQTETNNNEVFTDPIEPIREPGDTVINEAGEPMVITSEGEQVREEDLQLDATGKDEWGIRRRPIPLSDVSQGRQQPVQREQQVLSDSGTSNTGGLGMLGGTTDDPENLTPDTRANVRAQPLQIGLPRRLDEDPFAPVGVRWGTFDVFSRLEQEVGYTNNAARSADSDGGWGIETRGRLQMRSDWSLHQLDVTANGQWARTYGDDGETYPSADVLGDLRLDLPDRHTLNLRSGYNYSTEGSSNGNLPGDAKDRNGIHDYNVDAELAQNDRRFGYELEGRVRWRQYEDVDLIGGGSINQDDRSYTEYGLRGRLVNAVSEAYKPFIEGRAGWRNHDRKVDRNGQERDNFIYAIRGGVTFDYGEKWNGEIAVGYENQNFDDKDLETLDGITLDANVVWSPVRDTTVTFTASSALDESTSTGESGALVHNGNVLIERRITDRLSSSLSGGVSLKDYKGSDRREDLYNAAFGLDYWLNRHFAITGDVEYEKQDAKDDGSRSYDATTVKAGVLWQN